VSYAYPVVMPLTSTACVRKRRVLSIEK
jgi:hypothetical protein